MTTDCRVHNEGIATRDKTISGKGVWKEVYVTTSGRPAALMRGG